MAKSKSDLIEAVMAEAKEGDITSKSQADRIVSLVFKKLEDFVAEGESVTITKFGTFSKVERQARKFKTPQGDIVEKPAVTKMLFKSSKCVTDKLN